MIPANTPAFGQLANCQGFALGLRAWHFLVTSMCDDSASRSNWKTGFANDGVDRNGNGKCVQLCHGSVSCR